jgi:cysteine synthase
MYELIDLTVNEEQLKKTVERAKERNVVIPTFAQMKDPSLVPDKVKAKLADVGLWDLNPLNLFRVTWKNEAKMDGGGFLNVPNYIEIPKAITGVDAKIVAMAGKFFPTGAHKVGPSIGCLVPRLVTGQFDPTYHQAVWPSTGNYCRGGAFDANLLGCESIAILPEEMSQERFDWLKDVAGEVIATPGCESNVKEIYDKTWELIDTRDNVMIFNQFAEFGNCLWHYTVTGDGLKCMIEDAMVEGDKFFGSCFTSGSAGTTHAGEFLKNEYPGSMLAVGEATQCPTLLNNGFGGHRIEGIGDKHVPWIHNLRATDMIVAIDDEDSLAMLRLFNEPAGKEYLKSQGIDEDLIAKLEWVGISSAANIAMAIKMAKYYELGENDVIATVLTDSAEMYGSRLAEMKEERGGKYDVQDAAIDHAANVLGLKTDEMEELTYLTRKRIHNLKYYTWIEQQAKDVEELNAQWFNPEEYWGQIPAYADKIDVLINKFNDMTGVLENM